MRWIEANGVSLRHDLVGSGPETVVLIHEAGGALESWSAVAAALAAHYRVLRYDQRGFGLSERSAILSLDQMVEDLAALLDGLGLGDGPVHLVGTAIGGTIAVAFAARNPGRVASLTVSSPVTGALPDGAKQALSQRASTIEREGMRAVTDASLDRSYPSAMRTDPDAYGQYRLRFLSNDPYSFAALSRMFTTLDLSADHAGVACPALVIGCLHDPIKPAAECADLAARLADGRYAEAASGHFLGVMSPELLLNLLIPFLESVNAR